MTNSSSGAHEVPGAILSAFSLTGRVAIVTGASSGLGAEVAVGLAEAGAEVVICARRVDKLEQTQRRIQAIGGSSVAVATDVTDVDACASVVERATVQYGSVDVLVNNAGVAWAAPSTREDPADFRRVIETNLLGSYWMAQACGRVMGPGSSIVNIGSVLGSMSLDLPQAGYAASKAAIIGLTRDLAQQWTGRRGIRVNAIAPGFFPSEMLDEYPPGYLDQMVRRVPAQRLGTSHELVAGVVFLASPASSYISGVLLPIDGGLMTG